MNITESATYQQNRTTYIVAGIAIVALTVIALLTFHSGKSSQQADQKATQLIAALTAAGARAPSKEQVVRVLGDDGGAVCDDPNGSLRKGILLGQLMNGAAGPGMRPIISDNRVELRERVSSLMARARSDLAELVAIPSVADPRQYPPEECARAAQWVLDAFAAVGFTDAHLAETADGSQAVVGSRPCGDPDAVTVLLYAHYDVQPPLDETAWRTPPFELTEVDGRWHGRGTADCKGNIVMHLTALRALGDDVPVNLKLVVEGSEEQGTGGLEDFVPKHADLLRADAVLVCDTGNAAVGRPAATVSLRGMVNVVVTVEALATEVHSGMFGGPAPDALAALIEILASLRDEQGNTTITGLDNTHVWEGAPYPPEDFRKDAGIVRGGALLGSGTVSDMLWARPAVTVLGIDCAPVVGSAAAITPDAAARLNLRIPPGTTPHDAERALVE